MSTIRNKAWMVAGSIAALEVLKYQGICRWNYTLRSIQQHAKNGARTCCQQAKRLSAISPCNKIVDEKLHKSEESLRAVMFLSCWGPN